MLTIYLVGRLSYVFPSWSAKIACRWFLTPPDIAAPEKEKIFLATAQKHLKINGCALWGYGDSPKRVLLIHGWAGRGAQMRYFVNPLVQLGFEVWLMDAPGHGQSDKVPTNMARFAETILKVAEHFGELQAVIGHSLGGAASVVAVGMGALIQQLVLIGSPAKIEKVFNHFSNKVGLSPRAHLKFYQFVEAEVGLSPETVSPYLIAPKIAAKGLLIYDPEDSEVSFQHALDLEQVWPHVRLERIHKVGHYRILRAPQTIALVQEFLRSHNR